MEIIEGKLYFIKDEFIEKYNPKYHLMENKEESIIIKNKEDLKNKLQQGLDDIKLNKTYSLDEVSQKLDNL